MSNPRSEDPRSRRVSYRKGKSWARGLSTAYINLHRTTVLMTVRGAGFSELAAQAFVVWSGLETDYTWSPLAREYGAGRGRGGFGIAQFTGVRARGLIRWAGSRGLSPTDMRTQTAFLHGELTDDPSVMIFNKGTVITHRGKGGRRRLDDAFRNATSLADHVDVWMRWFFRPGIQNRGKVRQAIKGYSRATAKRLPKKVIVKKRVVRVNSGTPVVTTRNVKRPVVRVSSNAVKNYQSLLNQYGGRPRLVVDGQFGPRTRAAARSLGMNPVADYTLLVEGKAVTHPKFSVTATNRFIRQRIARPHDVIASYQTLLNMKRDRGAQLVVDGAYGARTHSAVLIAGRDPVMDLLALAKGQRISM